MPLPDEIDIKNYLKVETTVEDDLIASSRENAMAEVAQYLRLPLTSASRAFRGRRARTGDRGEPLEQLTIPVTPCATTATITDVLGDTVDDALYTIDGTRGHVNAAIGEAFNRGPYTVTVSVGWDHDEDYNDIVGPLLWQTVLDLAVDIYRRRNTGAVYEQSGGQVSITYTEDELPPRPRGNLERLRQRANRGRIW